MEPVHGGQHVIDAARAAGVSTVFTLSGAHIFPVFDAAVGGRAAVEAAPDRKTAEESGPMRLVDTRHEQTAAFAAEAMGKLTRTPGFVALTAGPGVTNGVSAIASARFNGSPMVVVGGRSPDMRWGTGALQELDHPPIVSTITKAAWTTHDVGELRADADRAFALAESVHMGPVFFDIPMDVLFGIAPRTPHAQLQRSEVHALHFSDIEQSPSGPRLRVTGADGRTELVAAPPLPDRGGEPYPEAIDHARALLAQARHPVLILGGGVWMADAVEAARELVAARNLPVIANGMGRGIVPPSDRRLVTRARGAAFKGADLVIVAGTPLDFRLGFGVFGNPPAKVIHLVDAEDQHSSSAQVAVTVVGDLRISLTSLADGPPADEAWLAGLAGAAAASAARDSALLAADSDPIHPARIYGELTKRLTDDAVVIGDGGDFVSFAGKFIEPAVPGRWLDPGPYGCLGTGPGYALAAGIAHPGAPTFLLLGDGAAGFSLMDVDSLVRHRIPVVMIVGNNAGWNLEKHPMRMLYGYDVLADLRPTRYDEVVIALGGGGETVTRPEEIGAALDRAMASGLPYLVNVMTDPEAAYPRATLGV